MFANRSTEIDYQGIDTLIFIGCYQRRLPVSLARMMENAYDWEHLPHVHESSFQAIELVSQGDWGWQAIVTLPSHQQQHLELLVDKSKNYWATTVLSGAAKGVEIHTQANHVADREVDISVNFYLPKSFAKVLMFLNIAGRALPFTLYKTVARKLGITRIARGDTTQTSILITLQAQYSVLYDEDELLMSGRQEALDRRRSAQAGAPSKLEAGSSAESGSSAEALSLGTQTELKRHLPKLVEFGRHRYVLNRWQDQWVIYAADCAHLLGPLQGAEIDPAGIITCPWHGYRFSVLTGENCSSDKKNLRRPPIISVVDDELILKRC